MDQLKPISAIVNCDQIVTVCSNGELYRCGSAQDKLELLERQSKTVGCSIVFDEAGLILALGPDDVVEKKMIEMFGEECWQRVSPKVNGQGCSVIPGLIDAHTHPVWAGDRVDEFDRKLRGATYMDIHKKGGGIHFTVDQTRAATESSLLDSLLDRVKRMADCGTTVVECKTGYGLNFETERKMLNVIRKARKQTSIELVSTFLGAHAVPKGMTSEQGVRNVIEMMHQLKACGENFGIEFLDVFCEKGVYNFEQSERILKYGQKVFPNAKVAFHGDELCDLNCGQLAAQIEARSVAHLEYVNQKSISKMSQAKVAAILCPTTCYLLKLPSPPARDLIKASVPVVVATDYNPNAMCYSLPMAMNLAAVQLGMSLNETLVAATINAAYALNRSKTNGSLEVGKRGDCLLVNAPDWRHLVYQFGDVAQLIRLVFKDGKIVAGTEHTVTEETSTN